MNKIAPRATFLVLAALPALLPLFLILKYGVNFPFLDEWDPDIAGVYIKAHDHQLTFRDLVAQHNEHRILFPRIVYLALNGLTHWNVIAELVCQWVIVLLTSLGILWLCRQTHAGKLTGRAIFLWFVCNVLIFTPAAWENWLWGIGLANAMPMMFIVAALVVIGSKIRSPAKTIVAIALAGAASYSSGNGILVWPLASIVLVWPLTRQHLRDTKWSVISWFASCVVLMSLYFVHYHKPAHRGIHPYPTSIAPVLEYIPIFLGSPFAFWGVASPHSTALLVGIAMIALLIILCFAVLRMWWKDRESDVCVRMLPWLAIAGFAVLSAAMAASSRAGLGADHPLNNSRYVTYAIYLPVALLGVCSILAEAVHVQLVRVARVTFIALSCIFIVLVPLTYADAIEQCRLIEIQRREGKASLLLINVLPNNPLITELIFPDLEPTIRQARRFNEMGYISPPLIDSADASKIEQTDPSKAAEQGRMERMSPAAPGELAASGWAISNVRSAPADMVFLTYDNADAKPIIFALATTRTRRDDVARQAGDSNYLFSGWYAQFPLAALPQNLPSTTIAAWALDTDTGKAVKLHGTISITPQGRPAPRHEQPAASSPR